MAERGKRRARLRDVTDAATVDLAGALEDTGVQLPLEVVETHAVDAADLDAGLHGEIAQALFQPGLGIFLQHAAGIDGRRACAMVDGGLQRTFELRVAECDHHVLDGLRQGGEVGIAG